MKTYLKYIFGTILLPARAFRRLMADPHPFRRGLQAVFVTGFLHALTAAGLGAMGAVPMAPVFLPFVPENYYFWQMIFALPLLLAVWLFLSTFVQAMGRSRKRGGSLQKTSAALAFAFSGPLLLAWIPQTAIAVFYALGMGQHEMVDILTAPGTVQTVFLGIFAAAVCWSYVLVVIAVSVSQRVRWWKGLILGTLTEALFLLPVVLAVR
jgi:hypothetical protein